ncbi:MAG: hypothetical protein IPL31_12885 [Saprospiraceae bacterium]|nr:hypothetical protein [Saprospiraceae bacterium]
MLIPIFGAFIFIILYVFASFLYPGGCQVSKNSIGFSWTNNYWCNLLNENGINGQYNPAKPIAMLGMLVLSLTLSFFWILFPIHFSTKRMALTIQISGTLAMIIPLFLFSNLNHDIVTNLAAIFGIIASIGTFIVLYKAKWYWLFVFGLLNILLVGLNNYVYHSKELIVYLPVIQKISFAIFLIWICCLCINIFIMARKNSQ